MLILQSSQSATTNTDSSKSKRTNSEICLICLIIAIVGLFLIYCGILSKTDHNSLSEWFIEAGRTILISGFLAFIYEILLKDYLFKDTKNKSDEIFSETRQKIESINLNLDKIKENTLESNLVAGSNHSTAFNQKEWYERINLSIKNAKSTIDLTAHGDGSLTISSLKDKKEIVDVLYSKIKKNPNIIVRWIMSLNCKEKADSREKIDWTFEVINKFRDMNNFNLRYSLVDMESQAPPQSFQIIDSKIKGSSIGFVIDMGKGQHNESETFNDMFTNDPIVVEQLQNYYDRYWSKCEKLKDGAKIYQEKLDALKKQYKD